MTRPSSFPGTSQLARFLVLAGLALVGGTIATSCLTPDATFIDEATLDGEGGTNPGDGDVGDGDGDVTNHCTNRTKDADETDTDCGGRDCEPCGLGRKCEAGSDCVNGTCTLGKCQMPSCTDGDKNDTETDVDCGGESCSPCGDGEVCEKASDCESSSCKSGTCAAPTCSDRILNGTESDVDCGGGCDACEAGEMCVKTADCLQPPEGDPSSSLCEEGICTLICAVGQADCNRLSADGCEVNTTTDLAHCGACGDTCNPAHSTASKCVAGECEIDFENGGCTGSWVDCNGMADDGCEVNTATSALNCGDCGQTCSDAHGTPTCVAGECEIECEAGFDNCDGASRENGCEVDTNTSIEHCGVCLNDCPTGTASQSPNCVDGECGLTNCPAGLGDCDGDGNCTDELDTTTNCGGCGITCAASNATTTCADAGGGNFECRISACVDSGGGTFEDCDGSYDNGCESNVKESATNCGGCAPANGTNCNTIRNNDPTISQIACVNGSCDITSCTGTNVDCNDDPGNGCEVNSATNTGRCGGCLSNDANPGSGLNCNVQFPNATGTCVSSVCQFAACNSSDWGNCSGGTGDGCETDLRTAEAHCGACGTNCVADDGYTTTNTCVAKVCGSPLTCNSNGLQCDANVVNGCENVATDSNNCGACGNICGGAGRTDVATYSCSGKACSVTCNNNKCPNSTASKACTLSLGTTSNCTSCGEVCSGSTPICTATGCKDHLPIAVSGSKNFSATIPSGSTTYTLSSTTNAYRGLIIAVATYRGIGSSSTDVSWSGGSAVPTLAHREIESGGESAIYYLKQSELPAAGTVLTIQVNSAESWGGMMASVIEISNMHQTSPLHQAGGNRVTTACPHANSRSSTVGVADSLVVAVAQARENSAGTATAIGVTELYDIGAGNQNHGAIGYVLANNTLTAGFNMSLCWASVLSTATFRPWAP